MQERVSAPVSLKPSSQAKFSASRGLFVSQELRAEIRDKDKDRGRGNNGLNKGERRKGACRRGMEDLSQSGTKDSLWMKM